MKTLNDYMAMNYRMEIIEDREEGGYVVSYPELPGCLTCGETIESAVANAIDAKKAWLEAALEEGIEIHEPDSLDEYSGQFKLRIPRSLHRSLVEHSKKEGISMNQYCVYLLSRMMHYILSKKEARMAIKSEAKLTTFEAISMIVGNSIGTGIIAVPYLATKNSMIDVIWMVGAATSLM